MKNLKNLLILVALALPVFLPSCRNLIDDDTYSSEYKKVQKEVRAESLKHEMVKLYYINRQKKTIEEPEIHGFFRQDGDILFVEVANFIDTYDENFIVSQTGTTYTITKNAEKKPYLTLDFATGEAFYSDYDYFFLGNIATAINSADIIANNTVLTHWPGTEIRGANVSYKVNLKDYNIPLVYEEGYGFIPVSTLTFLCGMLPIAYNGNVAYCNPDYSDLDETLYKGFCEKINNQQESWSKDFAEYSYGHLCLAMDMKYGRKDYLGITSSFDSWFEHSGLKEDLISTNIQIAEFALGKMLLQNIGDLHTYYHHMTPLYGLDEDGKLMPSPPVSANLSESRFENNAKYLQSLWNNKFVFFDLNGDGSYDRQTDKVMNIFIPVKDENKSNKNTIFMTFNSFAGGNGLDYSEEWNDIESKGTSDGVSFYEYNGSKLDSSSTISNIKQFIEKVETGETGYGISFENERDPILLTIVSNYIINKLKSSTRKIENAVLDLSLNTGGDCDEEAFISSWFFGQSDYFIQNAITGTKAATTCIADVNYNGKTNSNSPNQYAMYEITKNTADIKDPQDTICDLNRYCIVSITSFSCGNIFPIQAAFKNKVTLLGQRSGGGTCAVETISMPSGTLFCTSSPFIFSTLVNGSFVDVDKGAEVDIGINPQDFGTNVYNRENFCDLYIN